MMSGQNRPNEIVRRNPCPGLDSSTFNGLVARIVLAAAVPQKSDSFVEEARAALGMIKRFVVQSDPPVSFIGQAVFLADYEDRKHFGRMTKELFRDDVPLTTYIAQRPCGGASLAVELWGVEQDDEPAEIIRADEEATIIRRPGVSIAQLAYRRHVPPRDSFDRAVIDTFRILDRRLGKLGFRFDQVLRSWFYIGGIESRIDGESRYERLNRVRSDFYGNLNFLGELLPDDWSGPVFPASTGIGADGGDITVSCLAVAAEPTKLTLFPLENPRQTAAYRYDENYGEQPPKFARAMAAVSGERAVMFISGTASIAEADSKHLDDVERQTRLTLDNIAELISADNFRRHGFAGFGATLNDMASARVYIKRAEDYDRVRSICRERIGDLPAVFVAADVCRPELLVEIEGVAVSQRM